MKVRRFALPAAAAAIALGALAAAPAAFADSGPLTATATIFGTKSETLTMTTSAVNFSGRNDQTLVPGSAPVTYSVQSNENFSLTLAPSGAAKLGGTSASNFASIMNNNLAVAETGVGTSPNALPASGAAVTIDNETTVPAAGKTYSYTENWSLTIPANTIPDTYTEGFVYTVLGS